MAAPSFDLIDIIRTVQKRKGFILLVTAAAMLLGGTFHLVKKKKYKAEARFLVNNPLYGDRSTLFRSIETRYVDYFGGDDELDKITALANSDTVKDKIIRNCDFDKIYKFGDMNNDTARSRYLAVFDKNFNLKRSEYKDIQVSYIAYEPNTAAGVANMTVKVLDDIYKHYYTSMHHDMMQSLKSRVSAMDSSINALTDTLAAMRDKYGIYSIISPSRQNVISGDVKTAGKGSGMAVEQIQNVESVKDELVTDRAHYISLLNEFAASSDTSMTYLKIITRATPPAGPTGASMLMTLMSAAVLGIFFSTIWVLMVAYYQKLNAVLR
jgi:uncharacterized protein involved in exopolysaccharide biosynthesis